MSSCIFNEMWQFNISLFLVIICIELPQHWLFLPTRCIISDLSTELLPSVAAAETVTTSQQPAHLQFVNTGDEECLAAQMTGASVLTTSGRYDVWVLLVWRPCVTCQVTLKWNSNIIVMSGGGLPTVVHFSGAPLVWGNTSMSRRPIRGSSQTRKSTPSRFHTEELKTIYRSVTD